MSAISPIVGIAKIISQYSTIVVGLYGVLYDGKQLNIEAIKALAKAQEAGKKIKIRGYGLAVIDKSLDELALDTIEEINVKGKVLCSERVKKHLGLK